jgi:DNA-binding SARP family transcriptional activator/pimeloyl-ACP methyl ester carboxylesterase
VRVDFESGEVALGSGKERALLAALAVSAGHVVASEALVDALWGDAPPRTARKTLQTYVSNIRRVLGADVISTEASGYALQVAVDDVDVVRFRALVHDASLRAGTVDEASAKLSKAVALWRGDPFADAASDSALAAEGIRIREEYLTALEARIAADLAAGRHADVVGELEALVREHPFRERLWGHLMVALYRGGRQADALAAYQRARNILTEELGLEPGGELKRLERAVLEHDASLEAPSPARAVSIDAGEPTRSPVRYAVCRDGVHVAYQIVGNGPIDIVAVPGFISHLDIWWDAPTDTLVRRLASFSRLILFDKRGMGLSDRPPSVDVEHWVEDTNAVLDAAGCERAVILGISAGAPTAALFAATHPERTRALVLAGGHSRMYVSEDYEIGFERSVVNSTIDHFEMNWGTGVGMSMFAPSRASDPAARAYWARYQTISASPSSAAAFLRGLTAIDVRHALPAITVPTLLLHAARDAVVPVEAARYMQRHIPGATLVELDSDIHLIWLSDAIDDITREIESFIARAVPATDVHRALAIVLAVALAAPTHSQASLIESIVDRFRGHSHAGRLATFDGPVQAIRCGLAIVAELRGEKQPVAVGLHSGECEFLANGVRGVAVTLAERLAAAAEPGEVLVSQTVRDLVVGSTLELRPLDRHAFDGVPGEWDVFAVGPSPSLR